MNCNLLPGLRKICDILRHWILHVQQPTFPKQQNASTGELLCHREDAVLCGWGVKSTPFFVRKSEAFFKFDFAIDADKHCPSKRVLSGLRGYVGVCIPESFLCL